MVFERSFVFCELRGFYRIFSHTVIKTPGNKQTELFQIIEKSQGVGEIWIHK